MKGEESPRIRGWIFVETKDPNATAEAMSRHFEQGGDDYVVVRADVVVPEGREDEQRVVIPVDVADQGFLQHVRELIKETPGVSGSTFYEVKTHNPWPPHGGHCFVTEAELEAHPAQEFSPPGRHPKSPGRNAWG